MRGSGSDAVCVVRLTLISFVYLDLYVLGVDALINSGSFMRIKYLFVLIYIRNKGEVGTCTIKHI